MSQINLFTSVPEPPKQKKIKLSKKIKVKIKKKRVKPLPLNFDLDNFIKENKIFILFYKFKYNMISQLEYDLQISHL